MGTRIRTSGPGLDAVVTAGLKNIPSATAMLNRKHADGRETMGVYVNVENVVRHWWDTNVCADGPAPLPVPDPE